MTAEETEKVNPGAGPVPCRSPRLTVWSLAVACTASAVAGDIRYDSQTNRITVAGYPEERPATLDDVLTADRARGWGKVAHEPLTDTFTMRATLWIGTNRDLGTFFQIGRPGHPAETLVLHGDLVVCPPRKNEQRHDGRYRISNRLTMGHPERPDIRPMVKMACSRKGEFGVRVLMVPMPKEANKRKDLPLGELFMFHSTLTATRQDADHTYSAEIWLSHAAVNYRLQDSTISWWDGGLFRTAYIYTRRRPKREEQIVRGVTFQNGGSAHGPFDCEDCTFRNLAVARVDAGATRCVFEGNQVNCQLTPYQVGALFIDCTIGSAQQPWHVPRSTRPEKWLRNYSVYRRASDLRLVLNPGVVERVSLPVRVEDNQGRPITGAVVTVDCPSDHEGLAVQRGLAVTGRDGLTPSDAAGRALVITTRELRPTDDPERPQVIERSYRLRVKAPGYAPREVPLRPGVVLPRPLAVALLR